MDATRWEIESQAVIWTEVGRVLQDRSELFTWLRGSNPKYMVGCGTSYYLAQAVAASAKAHDLPVDALPAGEFLIYGTKSLDPITKEKPIFMGASRSGNTTETVEALKRAQSLGFETFAVTTNPQGEILQYATRSLVLPMAQEKSVVMTRSFTSMLLSFFVLLGTFPLSSVDKLVEKLAKRDIIQEGEAEIKEANYWVYLGSGLLYGVCREGGLKMKEMTQDYTDAYEPLEFRHGPISLVGENTKVFGFVTPQGEVYEEKLYAELVAMGANVTSLKMPGLSAEFLALSSMPLLQAAAWARARQKGKNPDEPHSLVQTVRIDLH